MVRTVITINDLTYCYPRQENHPVLSGLCLTIREGERVALLGANGSGKSTLLNCLNGLLSPPPNAILVHVNNASSLDPSNEKDLETIRRTVGTVLQNPDDQIISSIVEEDTAFGPENLGFDKTEAEERADNVLQRTGLVNQKKQQVRFLSGGEKQRLALAGMLALNTEILILDEAVSMLDPLGRDDFLALLDELSASGKTIIQVTHSLEEAFYCSRALVLCRGSLAFDGTPEELFARQELESWGFAITPQVQLSRMFNTGFTMDAEKAAENIAGAFKNSVVPEDALKIKQNDNTARNANTAGINPTINFINVSHKYSPLFPGGISTVNFKIKKGELVALIGQSGSGKSTILKHINALLLPTNGNVVVLGSDTLDRKTNLSVLRMRAALSVQSPERALFEQYVADDVAFGPKNSGIGGEELVRRVKTAMENSGLPFDKFADREIRSLSGGEKRRAAIAGTAAMESEIVLFDEVFTGLDGFNQKKITDLICSFRREEKTVIITTHSMETAALADKVGVMAEGRLAAFGTPHEIFGRQWDPAWGLSLPWITEVSHRLAGRSLIPSEAVLLTADELYQCINAPSEYLLQRRQDTEERYRENKLQHVRCKRKKTGIEFFRTVSFEELPDESSPLQKIGSELKLFLLFMLFAATVILPPPFFTVGVLIIVLGTGWFAGSIVPLQLLRGFIRIMPWLFIVYAVQLIYRFDLMRPLFLILRIAALSSLLSLFCAVTPVRCLVRVSSNLFSFFGLPARDISLAIGIMLRFIPILSEEAEHIISAQLSRGGRKGRFRLAFSLVVPLFLRALERAETATKAMMLRCYHQEKLGRKETSVYSIQKEKP